MYRILYVDDELTNRMLFKRLMKDLGVTLDVAESGMEALVKLKSTSYDLLFFDHIMPGMSGVELFESLKAIGDNPNRHTPCVALTGNTMEGAAEMYREKGFAEYIKKPVDPAEIRRVVDKYLPGLDTGAKVDKFFDLPAYLRGIKGIDSAYGLKMNGSEDSFVYSIEVYKSVAEKRQEEIEAAFSGENWKAYTIQMHSLKSAAAIIGALELSEAAAEMESAGAVGDYEKIRLRHREFMFKYVTLMNELEKKHMPSALDLKTFRELDDMNKPKPVRQIKKNALVICGRETITLRTVLNKLRSMGYRSFRCHPTPFEFDTMKDNADIYVFICGDDIEDEEDLYTQMKNACVEKFASLMVIGDPGEYAFLETIVGKKRITCRLQTPLIAEDFMDGIDECFQKAVVGDRRKTLLIVDDDEMYLRMAENWLSEDYDVLTAHSGTMAISVLATNDVDAILLDYEMPVVDGPKSFEIIRMDYDQKDVPIIFLTGNRDRNSVVTAYGLNPSGYILKNTDRNELLKKIRECL